jgi:hypothetical protein
MVIPDSSIARVGCAISTAWADLFARKLIERAGARAMPVTPGDFLTHPRRLRFRALVYDLAPWSDKIADRITAFRQIRPDIPILFYLPPTHDAFALVPACGTLSNVRLLIQDRHDRGIRGLENDVGWLLGAGPHERLLQLVRSTLPSEEPVPRAICHTVLNQLAGGNRPSVRDVARALDLSIRTLQRDLATCGLPSPKELLDWLALLHIHFVARWSGQSEASVARRLGLDANERYRLRKRLLERTRHVEVEQSSHTHAAELIRFMRRCRGCRSPQSRIPTTRYRDISGAAGA